MADTPTYPAAATGHPHEPHRHHARHHRAVHTKSFHAHLAHAHPTHIRRPAVPATAGQAVTEAIAKEHVPNTWQPSLVYIMAQESGGVVGAANHRDSARGLFQLTRPNYHLNPHGAASFGNATEEVQGGIRYIRARYQTADNAARFWQLHGWY